VLNGTKHTSLTALLPSFFNAVDFSTLQPQLLTQFNFQLLTFFTSQSFTLPLTYLFEKDERAVSGDSRFLPASLPHFIFLSPSFFGEFQALSVVACSDYLYQFVTVQYMKRCVFQNYYGYTRCTKSLALFSRSIPEHKQAHV
jgi:hypothetical protein